MMKKMLTILLCGMLMMTICACGSSDSGEAEQPSEEPAAEQTAAEGEPAAEEEVQAEEPEEQKTETAAKAEASKIEETDAVRLVTDYAVKNAAEEGLVFEIDNAQILDQNKDAWLVSIPVGEEVNGEIFADAVYIYRVDKKTGTVKFITGAQDYWDGMIDITKGVVAENAAETEYAD